MTFNRRNLVQTAAAAVLVILWLLTASPLKFPVPANAWLRLDPLLALANWVAVRSPGARFWPAAGLLLISVAWGRVFCAWGCPVGALLDLQTTLLRKAGYRGYRRLNKLPALNLVVLALVIVSAAAGWGAVTGLLDPLVFAHRALTFVRAGRLPETLLVVLALGLVAPRFWCRFLCPLGGLLGIVHRPVRLWRGQGRGVEFPLLPESRASAKGDGPRYSRREFLGLLAGGLVVSGGAPAVPAVRPRGGERFLRPPGALSERRFTAACVRCGECIKVCPTRGLLPALTEAGLGGLWTPHLVPRVGECKRCMLCGKVCPTGALRPIPVALMKLGTAAVDTSACWAWNGTRPCRVCVDRCPKKIISRDAQGRPVVDAAACDGCGTCEKVCPVRQAAITVTSAGERRRDAQGQDAADTTVREEL